MLANSAWGLIGLGIAIAVLHVAALQFGSAIGLSLALGDLHRLEPGPVVARAQEGRTRRAASLMVTDGDETR